MASALTFSNHSTFTASIPYGAATLAVGAIGTGLTLLAAATALKVAGVIIGLIGVFAFTGVVLCGVRYSHSVEDFKANVHNYIVASFGLATTVYFEQAIRTAFQQIREAAFGRR